MISISSGSRIFVYTQATDMRKIFNGLSGLVAEHFDIDPFSGHLFVFFNRKRDHVGENVIRSATGKSPESFSKNLANSSTQGPLRPCVFQGI